MGNTGLDIGTNMLVSASIDANGKSVFKQQRDAFYTIVPKSNVNRNSIEMSLKKRGASFITDGSDFIVVGEDALDIAIERNDVAKRPLSKGVISPKEKSSLPMLQLIIQGLVGKSDGKSKVVYSVPAAPIDSAFDIVYHTEIMGSCLSKLGYKSSQLNEAFAIALSELLDEGLTGVCLSYGAGMNNICVIHQGDPLVEFSITKSGDYIDSAVGTALDMSPSLIQKEKEAGIDLFSYNDKISEAVSVYYVSVIRHTIQNIAFELKKRKKELPRFRDKVPIIVAGGLTLATGFVRKFKQGLEDVDFPFEVGEVRRAKDPMHAVANGCLLASQL